jgi:hypothetical protein
VHRGRARSSLSPPCAARPLPYSSPRAVGRHTVFPPLCLLSACPCLALPCSPLLLWFPAARPVALSPPASFLPVTGSCCSALCAARGRSPAPLTGGPVAFPQSLFYPSRAPHRVSGRHCCKGSFVCSGALLCFSLFLCCSLLACAGRGLTCLFGSHSWLYTRDSRTAQHRRTQERRQGRTGERRKTDGGREGTREARAELRAEVWHRIAALTETPRCFSVDSFFLWIAAPLPPADSHFPSH